MARKARKITPSFLKKIIFEEAKKLRLETLEQGEEDSTKVDAEETDADELAGALAQDIDYIKALKIQESRLKRKLSRVRKAKDLLSKRIINKI